MLSNSQSCPQVGRVSRELAVSESVQAPGTPSVWVAEESFLPWSGGWWLGEAGTEVFYPKRLLPARWEDPQIWWGQRVICPVTPEGFKWPPQ